MSDKPNLQVEENKRIAEGVHKRRRLYTVVNTFLTVVTGRGVNRNQNANATLHVLCLEGIRSLQEQL